MSVRTLVKSIQNIMRQDTGVDGDAQRISQLCWMFFLKIIDDQDQELELMQRSYTSPIPERFQWRAWAADPEGITGEALLAFINDKLFPALKNLAVSNQSGDRRRMVRDVFEDAYNYMKSGQLMRQVANKINEIDFNNLTERQHFGDIYEQILNDLQSAGNAGEYYTPRAVTAFMADRIDPRPGETLFDPACGTGGFLTCSLRHMRKRYVKRPGDERKMQAALRAVEKKQLPHMLCVTNMLLHGVDDPSFVRHDNTLARPYIGWGAKDRVDIVLTNPPFGGKEEDGIESNFPQHFRTRETADLFLALIIRLLKPHGRAAVVLPDGSLFGEGVKTRLKEHLMQECNLHTIVRLPNSVFRPYASIGTNLLFFEKGEPTRDIWFYEHLVPDGQKAYSMTRPIRLEHLQGCIDWWGGESRQGRKQTERAWKVTAEEVKARGYNLDIKNPNTQNDDHGDPEELLEKLTVAEAETAALHEQLKAVLTEALAMNAELLLTHFDKITSTSQAIPRLRRFILDLAVRGNLVAQNVEDEPASELLNQIATEKTRLIKAGAIRPQKALPTVSPDEYSIELPPRWTPVRLADVAVCLDYKRKPINGAERRRRIEGKTPEQLYPYYGATQQQGWIDDYLFDEELILLGEDGAPFFDAYKSKSYVISGKTWVNNHAHVFKGILVSHSFLAHYLNVFDYSGRVVGATRSKLNQARAIDIPIPLPPLSEQHRIVAKVDELMALCDRLEENLTFADDTRGRLIDAVFHDSLAPSAAPKVAA